VSFLHSIKYNETKLKYLLTIFLLIQLNFCIAQVKDFSVKKEISEVVTSTELKSRSNAIPFFESKVLEKVCNNKYVWYKIVFNKKTIFSLCLIPNQETDFYTIDAFRVRGTGNICDSLSENITAVPNLLVKKTYTNTEQSHSFRSSTLYSTNIQVNENEGIYLLIYNVSGVDIGHVLGVKTQDGEYVFKTYKDTALYKVTCESPSIQSTSFAVIKNELCDEIASKKMYGKIAFENNKYNDANFTKKDILTNLNIPISNVASNKLEDPKMSVIQKEAKTPASSNLKNKSTNANIETSVVETKKNEQKLANSKNKIDLDNKVELKSVVNPSETISISQSLKKNEIIAITEPKVLYRITLPKSENDSNKVIVIPVIRSQKTNEIIDDITYINKNELEVRLKKSDSYNLELNVLGYKKYTQILSPQISSDSVVKLNIELTPLSDGDVFVFKNISFFPNTPVIKRGSENELLKLTSFLKECPHISISIEGHTNGNSRIPEDRERTLRGGAWAFHGSAKELSVERAKVIQEYLVEKGIDKSRLSIIGFGGKKPIDDIMDPEESYRNMRVEIRISNRVAK
jgi:outer membrane protein OmpA-like peptidoglycan-associated protein